MFSETFVPSGPGVSSIQVPTENSAATATTQHTIIYPTRQNESNFSNVLRNAFGVLQESTDDFTGFSGSSFSDSSPMDVVRTNNFDSDPSNSYQPPPLLANVEENAPPSLTDLSDCRVVRNNYGFVYPPGNGGYPWPPMWGPGGPQPSNDMYGYPQHYPPVMDSFRMPPRNHSATAFYNFHPGMNHGYPPRQMYQPRHPQYFEQGDYNNYARFQPPPPMETHSAPIQPPNDYMQYRQRNNSGGGSCFVFSGRPNPYQDNVPAPVPMNPRNGNNFYQNFHPIYSYPYYPSANNNGGHPQFATQYRPNPQSFPVNNCSGPRVVPNYGMHYPPNPYEVPIRRCSSNNSFNPQPIHNPQLQPPPRPQDSTLFPILQSQLQISQQNPSSVRNAPVDSMRQTKDQNCNASATLTEEPSSTENGQRQSIEEGTSVSSTRSATGVEHAGDEEQMSGRRLRSGIRRGDDPNKSTNITVSLAEGGKELYSIPLVIKEQKSQSTIATETKSTAKQPVQGIEDMSAETTLRRSKRISKRNHPLDSNSNDSKTTFEDGDPQSSISKKCKAAEGLEEMCGEVTDESSSADSGESETNHEQVETCNGNRYTRKSKREQLPLQVDGTSAFKKYRYLTRTMAKSLDDRNEMKPPVSPTENGSKESITASTFRTNTNNFTNPGKSCKPEIISESGPDVGHIKKMDLFFLNQVKSPGKELDKEAVATQITGQQNKCSNSNESLPGDTSSTMQPSAFLSMPDLFSFAETSQPVPEGIEKGKDRSSIVSTVTQNASFPNRIGKSKIISEINCFNTSKDPPQPSKLSKPSASKQIKIAKEKVHLHLKNSDRNAKVDDFRQGDLDLELLDDTLGQIVDPRISFQPLPLESAKKIVEKKNETTDNLDKKIGSKADLPKSPVTSDIEAYRQVTFDEDGNRCIKRIAHRSNVTLTNEAINSTKLQFSQSQKKFAKIKPSNSEKKRGRKSKLSPIPTTKPITGSKAKGKSSLAKIKSKLKRSMPQMFVLGNRVNRKATAIEVVREIHGPFESRPGTCESKNSSNMSELKKEKVGKMSPVVDCECILIEEVNNPTKSALKHDATPDLTRHTTDGNEPEPEFDSGTGAIDMTMGRLLRRTSNW